LSRWYVKTTFVAAILLAIVIQITLRNAILLHKLDVFLTSFQNVDNHIRNHFYLSSNYAPVTEEHVGVPVEGELPTDLDGLLVRNGPNPILPLTKRYHWFDGHGMLHNLRIQHGKAIYTNQFVPTPRRSIELQAGEQVFMTIGELTGITGLLKVLLLSEILPRAFGLTSLEMGTGNTNALLYRNKVYCLNEGSLPFEIGLTDVGAIDTETTVGHYTKSFGDTPLDYPVSAHPKIDPRTGNLVFHGYTGQSERLKRDGPIKVGEWSVKDVLLQYLGLKFDDQHVSFSHDMMFTKQWIIAIDSSVHFDPSKMFDEKADFFSWNEHANLRIGLVPRISNTTSAAKPSTKDVRWMDVGKPYSIVHTLNAWEEDDGTVVLWAPLGESFGLSVDTKSSVNAFYMSEIRMNPATGDVSVHKVSNHSVEFPRVRDDCLGRKCRYGFAGIMAAPEDEGGDGAFKGFVSYDLILKKVHAVVKYPKNEFGGEHVVIPKLGSSVKNVDDDDEDNDDDGSKQVYLGTFVYNTEEEQSYFVLFDGDDATANKPVSRLRMPYRVPYGFHGLWVDGANLKAHIHNRKKHQDESPLVDTE